MFCTNVNIIHCLLHILTVMFLWFAEMLSANIISWQPGCKEILNCNIKIQNVSKYPWLVEKYIANIYSGSWLNSRCV